MAEGSYPPPWVLEQELSCLWADRWAALNQARARAQEGPQVVGEAPPGKRRLV